MYGDIGCIVLCSCAYQFYMSNPPAFDSIFFPSCHHILYIPFLSPMFSSLYSSHTLKTPGSAWPGKGSIGAKLHSGSKITRKLVSFLQTWQIMGSDWPSSGSHSVSSWLISGSSLTRNGVWPQKNDGPFPGQFLTRVFLECISILSCLVLSPSNSILPIHCKSVV